MQGIRTAGRWTAAVLGAVLAATAVTPAASAAPAPAGEHPGTAPGRLVHVTLITGDRVTARIGADGTVTVVAVKPGTGREELTFSQEPGPFGTLGLIPQDAAGPLRAGRLDPRLFDIAGLVAQGYDDEHSPDLPLIVGYDTAGGKSLAPAAPPAGTKAVRALDSVHGSALRAEKSRTGELWRQLGQSTSGRSITGSAPGGVHKVWLDGKVGAALDRSTAQIGAPQAWQSGWTGEGVKVAVLDTGIDAGHPDLAGSVGETSDFTGQPSGVADGDGHGTHVASIVAGDGAASDGRFKGVAPDAELLVGKVLDDEGHGQESWVLQGMEWAAARAPIVNVSLTGPPTDGTDPMAQAVNTLSARYGTLFVAAAGNSGRAGTVGTPGSADAALTVGAVDRDGTLAGISSQGPRTGDHAVKPDLTAPGTGIVATRAAGTDGQSPVSDRYTAISGTSMAAPHVAGAAALLAQQHPDWKGPQLKAALTSSARPAAGQSAYQQGAGLTDLARATGQSVYATANGTGIHFDGPPAGPAVTRTVTYHNPGQAPVTLDLAAAVTDRAGAAGPAGAFTVTPARLTVPAGGTAEATVTVDPGRVPAGASLTGRLAGTAPGGIAVGTAYAVSREAVRHTVTVQAVDRNGAPVGPGDRENGASQVRLLDLDTHESYGLTFDNGTATATVPEGRYNLGGKLVTPGADGVKPTSTMFLQPEIELRRDGLLTLDARQGRQITVAVPDRRATPYSLSAGYCYRAVKDGDCTDVALMIAWPGNLYVIPGGRITTGTLDFSVQSIQHGPATGTGPLPDRYDLLLHTTGPLPDPAFTVGRGDLASLKTVYYASAPGTAGSLSSYAEAGGIGGLSIVEPDFALPAARTEYVTVRDQRRETSFGQRTGPGGEYYPSAVTQSGTVLCAAGATCVERWNAAVTGPGLAPVKNGAPAVARGSDGTLTVFPQLFTDAAPGHYGSPLPDLLDDTVHLELERDGKRIGASDQPAADFALPAADSAYRLTARGTRAEPWALSGTVEAVWTFRSAAVAPGPGGAPRTAPLPIGVVRFNAPVNAENQAPRDQHTLTAKVERQAGAPAARTKRLTVQVSFDDGAGWQDAPVTTTDGVHRITVTPPAGAGPFVSLRTTAEDADGGTVQQTVLRAYRLKP
ncbi:S8 family serine peptidase [Kitasatospora sp. NPDC088351]|uniref:S8 family serine peptidase n=1 Tax=Kitasatospora sp. NPDC088351 TaxID=3155180 RepID=UPI003440AF05